MIFKKDCFRRLTMRKEKVLRGLSLTPSDPVVKLNKDQIREIRIQAQMTQSVFAEYLGVSVKTVEAWERGRMHPTGPAYRLMSFLAQNQIHSLPFITAE